MYSRLLLALSLPVFVACGLKIGEQAPKDKPIVIGGAGFSCMSEMGKKLDEFLGARLKEAEIRQFMGCLRYGFESFATKTRGLERNSFSPGEIRDFLTEYFLKEKRISDQLLKDFMIVKQALIGGPLDKVTRGDLAQAVDTLKFFEEQAIKLNPYMDLYNFQLGRVWVANSDNPRARIDEAVEVLRKVAEDLGHRFAKAQNAYPLKSFESLLAEFREFAGWEQIFTNARPPESWTEFLHAYKSIVTGDESGFVRPNDWAVLLSSSAGIYGLHIKIKYAQGKTSLLHGEGLEALIRTGDDLTGIAYAVIERQPRKVVTYKQIDDLINVLPAVGMMPSLAAADPKQARPLRPASLKMAARALFDRVLGDPSIPWRARKGEGISRLSVAQAVSEFSLWAEIQRFLDRTFRPDDSDGDGGRLQTLSEKLGPVGASEKLMKLMGERASPEEGLRVARTIEMQMRPLFRPNENQVFLTERSELPRHQVVHGFHNLSIMNIVRGAISLLMRGYSSFRGNDGIFATGMTAEDMQAFYMDLRDFGVDLGLFDPRSAQAGVRAFREANMFTYSGNGTLMAGEKPSRLEHFLEPIEAMEFLAFVYSGGNTGRAMYLGMMDETRGRCVAESRNAPASVHAYSMISRECFGRELMTVMLPRLKTMPTMYSELNRASPERRRQVSGDLMDSIFVKTSDPKYVEWHEVTTLAMVLHYTEAVMTRYNVNNDSTLDTREVWQAYKTFRGYMNVLTAQKCAQMIHGWANPASEAAMVDQAAAEKGGWTLTKEWLAERIKRNGCDNMPEFVSKAIFAHLVSTGKVPQSLYELVVDVDYALEMPWLGKDFNVDRSNLLKVFAALVKASSEPPLRN